MNIYEQIEENKQASILVVGVFVLLFLFLGFGFDYFYGIGAGMPVFSASAFAFGVASAYGGYRWGDRLVLQAAHARPLDPADPAQKQWQNVVEEMSISAGIPLPRTYVIDDPDPNAFATGRDPSHSSIVVTRGLLGTLNRDELQAVAAHEMSHIRNLDIRLMLILAVLAGSVALIADWAARGLFGGSRRRGRRETEGMAVLVILAVWLVTVMLAPIISRLLAMFVSRRREYLADASGAELTRNPMALATALEKIESHTEPTRSINQGTAHLCICDPRRSFMGSKEGWVADLFATHPPISKRIEALRKMAYAA